MQHHDRLPLLRGAAAGLVVLGAGVLLAAGLLPARPAVPEPPAWAGWTWWVLPVLLVWLAVLAISAFSGASRAAVAFRVSCFLLAVLAAWPAWWSVPYAEAALRGGAPAVGPALFAVGFGGVLVGAVGLAAVGAIVWPLHQPDLRWRPLRSVAGVAASALLVGAAVAGLVWWVGSGSVEATTTTRAARPAVPAEVGAVRWTWKPAPGRAVRDAVAAGPGVVVRVDDGIVALDGRTGKERWHYRWRGANASELVASPDGGRIAVRFASTQPRVVGVRVVGFDAMTGAVGFDDVLDLVASDDPRLLLTDHVLLVDHEDEYVGYDVRTGKRLWTYDKPGRCWRIGEADAPVPAHDAVLLRQPCGPAQSSRRDVVLTGGLLALDDRTGKVRWRLGRTVPALGSQYVWADAGGHVTWVGRDATDTDTRWSYALAAKDGTVLAERRPRSGTVADVSATLPPVCDRHEPGELYEALALDTASTGARLARSWICLTGKALIGLDAPRDSGPDGRGTVTVLPRDGASARTFEVDPGAGLVLAPGAVVAWGQAGVAGLA
ncbi:outer membrane protein assembly factor BamB family protein [Flindersiella endophytica]